MRGLFEDLEREALAGAHKRRTHATRRLLAIYRLYRGYVTKGLRCHFEGLIGRSLDQDPSARSLDGVITEIEMLLKHHKMRCDSTL